MARRERPWVVWLADRRELGAVRGLSVHGPHATLLARCVRRFKPAADAGRAWRRALASRPALARYRPVYEREARRGGV